MAIELWTGGVPFVHTVERTAATAEQEGWDGLGLTESQNLSHDTFINLALAAKATEQLRIGTAVSNPATRHPALAASAIATVQDISGGRAVFGLGRGDSALFTIGREPASVAEFETFLARVQGYLSGGSVDIDGSESHLRWLPGRNLPKVPVDVAATGERVIGVGARLAEQVTFSVGANPERTAWAVEVAHRAAAGRADGVTPKLGAYVHVAVHDDTDLAADLLRTSVAVFAHFSGMPGAAPTGVDEDDRATFAELDRRYDRGGHGRPDSEQARLLDREFIKRFAAVGQPDDVLRRLRELVATGLDRLVIMGPDPRVDADAAALSRRRFVEDVMPGLRA